jgi:hypothetical protein
MNRCRNKRQVSRSVLVLTLPSLRDATPATRGKLVLHLLRSFTISSILINHYNDNDVA